MVKGYKGFLITFEGGDGSGKDTIISKVIEELKKKGINFISTREPGGSKIAEKIRKIILDPEHKEMSIRTELLLYEASRAQHTEEILIPALKQGKLIISSRYYDSSTVYQGYVRGNDLNDVKMINMFASHNIIPDLTIVLDVDPKIGLARCRKNDFDTLDRLEQEGLEFHKKVNSSYLELAKLEPERFKVVDANKSIDVEFKEVMHYILEFCKKHARI
jgi:dTMP kinase